MKINKKSLKHFLPLSEGDILDLLHPAQAILGYFLASVSSATLNTV
jgi:hypothetical protein